MNHFFLRSIYFFLLLFPFFIVTSSSQDSDGYESDQDTLLQQSIRYDLSDSINNLLSHQRVDPNTTNRHQQNALHTAIIASRIKIAERLMKYGASITAQDVHGKTPLDYLTYREIPGNQEEYFQNPESYYYPEEVKQKLEREAIKYNASKSSMTTRSQRKKQMK